LRIFRKNTFRGVGCSLSKEPQKRKKNLVTSKGTAKSGVWGAEPPKPIATKFCLPGAMYELIKHADFGKNRLRGFGVAMGQYLAFPLTCFFAFATLSHYRASV